MARFEVAYTYTVPELLRLAPGHKGEIVERVPRHPVRPARRWDWNIWWAAVTPGEAALAHHMGHMVRMAPPPSCHYA